MIPFLSDFCRQWKERPFARSSACLTLALAALVAACSAPSPAQQRSTTEGVSVDLYQAGAAPRHSLTRELFAGVLTAELALQFNNPARAFDGLYDLARQTGYAELAHRALTVAEEAQLEEDAQQALDLWNKLDPDNERMRFVKAGEMFLAGDWAGAQTLAAELLAASDQPAALLEEFAAVGENLTEKSRFYTVLVELARPYADLPAVQLILAAAASKAKMSNQAKEHGLKAIELAPEDPYVLITGANYEFAVDPKATVVRLAAFLKDHPDNHQIRLSYSKALLRVRDTAELGRQLDLLEPVYLKTPTVFLMGLLAEEADDYDRAERYYLQHADNLAAGAESRHDLNEVHVRLAMVKLEQGHKQLAADWLDRVEGGAQYSEARHTQVRILVSLNRIDDACTVLDAIRTEDTREHAKNLRTCGNLLLKKNRYGEALAMMLKALPELEDDSGFLYQTAMVAIEAEDNAQAEKLLERFIKLNPDNPNGYNSLGYLWLKQGMNMTEAERLIVRAMELSGGTDPYVLDSYGWLRFRQAKFADAEKYLRQAQNTDPANNEIALHLAEVLLARGKKTEAHAVLRSVMEGEPQNAKARELLERNP